MDDDAHYNFMMPPSIWSKKPSPSRHKMTIAYAAEHHPGATPILSTREDRMPSTPIRADSPYCRRTRPVTPEEEAYRWWLISRIGAPSERIDDGPEPDTTRRR